MTTEDEARAAERVKAEQIKADPILEYFEFAHLPPHLQSVSQPFYTMAFTMVTLMPRSAERSAGLRKLLEAKDCFVRCAVSKVKGP